MITVRKIDVPVTPLMWETDGTLTKESSRPILGSFISQDLAMQMLAHSAD